MPYLIDANNLAGKLGILGKKDFDRNLAVMICKHLHSRKCKAILVFDGTGTVPERYAEGLTVYYSAENHYGRTADELIIRMARRSKTPRDYIVVTDDRELKEALEIISIERGIKIATKSTTAFYSDISSTREREAPAQTSLRDQLSGCKKREIEEELLRTWAK